MYLPLGAVAMPDKVVLSYFLTSSEPLVKIAKLLKTTPLGIKSLCHNPAETVEKLPSPEVFLSVTCIGEVSASSNAAIKRTSTVVPLLKFSKNRINESGSLGNGEQSLTNPGYFSKIPL